MTLTGVTRTSCPAARGGAGLHRGSGGAGRRGAARRGGAVARAGVPVSFVSGVSAERVRGARVSAERAVVEQPIPAASI